MLTVEHLADPVAAQARRQVLGPRGAFVGGGTALQLQWGHASPVLTLVAVGAVPAAHGVSRHGPWLRLGAATPLETLRHHAEVRHHLPLLASACDTLAALGVRHLATLGGNVGWRQGDTLAPLLALDAEAELAEGTREPLDTVLAREELPLLTALWVDTTPCPGVYEKVGHRAAFSPSRLVFAAARGPGGWRVAAGGAGLPVRRLRETERSGLEDLAASTLADLGDPTRARLARRLVEGHLR